MELANAVDYLGGSCTIADCAHQLKKKISGGFGVLISSAIKHDLIQRKGDRLSVSELYKKIKFSYNLVEKIDCQRVSFLHPVLYRKVYDRFKGKELPLAMLDKLLIREFQVEEKVSEKIAGFFVEGLKRLHLLKDGRLVSVDSQAGTTVPEEPVQMTLPLTTQISGDQPPSENLGYSQDNNQKINELIQDQAGKFVFSIQGNGINSMFVIDNNEDFQIVEALLAKVKRMLPSQRT